MTTETPEIIILRYGDIEIRLPKSIEDIHRAKKLLDMLDYELTKKVPEWDYNVLDEKPQRTPQTTPQGERQGQPTERPPEESCVVPAPIQTVLSTLQKDANLPSAGDQTDLIPKEGSKQEIVPERILEAPVNFFIPKFAWDKTKEKSYRTIFFYEHEDKSRAMVSYQASRVYTTKEAVMTIPYPVPRNYAPLRILSTNNRTGLRVYREYLYKSHHDLSVSYPPNDENNKGVWDDIQLDNGKNEAANAAEEKRLEKLTKVAEVNAGRWKDRVENETSPRTKELRSKFALKATMGIGAENLKKEEQPAPKE